MEKTEENAEDIKSEIQQEIDDIKNKQTGNLEIEVTDAEPVEENTPEEVKSKPKPKTEEYGQKVEKRIRKLVAERKEAEEKEQAAAQELSELKDRLFKLEQGSQNQQAEDFQKRYNDTKAALRKATEEGDTDAQIDFTEQLADMRSAIRIQEIQRQQQAQQAISPTVGKAQQTATNPAPAKAMEWWQKNNWFNSKGFEKETALARAIDVQLDLEGFDKNSEDYYKMLNTRLQKTYPELISSEEVTENKPRAKSSNPVTPSTGGSIYKGNRVRMTADQLRMARELGINDEAGLKKYALEIQKSQGR